MSDDNNNIKRFTAGDIEKYQKGLLSAKEKHDLEKAALDDPFLADALEGYTTAGVYVADDMKELNDRLVERIEKEKAKVVAMPVERRQRFAAWKVAAIIVLIAGAGFLTYQFGFNKKESNIAESNAKDVQINSDTITSNGTTQEISKSTITTENNSETKEKKSAPTIITKTNVGATQKKSDTVSYVMTDKLTSSRLAPEKDLKEPEVSRSNKNDYAINQLSKPKSEDIRTTNPVALNKSMNEDTIKRSLRVDGAFEKKRSQGYVANNIFRGRVMDANNNPVPFANITNIADSVGTYADARGVFNFVSTDTVLNVEVRSVGFNNINTQLRNRAPENNVVLQEDRSLSARVLLDTARSKALRRSRESNVTVEESEPEDGWGLYDTYIVNNLKMPDEIKTKQTSGEVEVSFEVNKYGEPVNFKITKSLCDACDKEAIRLIKEGPKWKRKAKKGRTTVTVSF